MDENNPATQGNPTLQNSPVAPNIPPVDPAAAAEPITTVDPIQPINPEPAESLNPAGSIVDPVATPLDQTINSIDPTVAPVAPAPKKNKGLKIGLIAGASVLLAGGIGGGVYAYVHNQPENVMFHAVSNLLNAKNLALTGRVTAENPDASGFIKVLEISLEENATASGDAFGDVTATFTLKADLDGKTQDFSLSTSEIAMRDGVVYIKIDNLKKIADQLIDLVLEYVNAQYQTAYQPKCGGSTKCVTDCASDTTNAADCLSTTVITVTRDDIPQEITNLIDQITSEVDGTWWKISIPDLLDELDLVDSQTAKEVKSAYSCLLNQIQAETQKGSQYLDLFKQYPFASIEKVDNVKFNGATAYKLNLDAANTVDFGLSATKIVDTAALSKCVENLSGSGSIEDATDKINREDAIKSLEDELKEMPNIYLGISGWSHQLSNLYTEYANDSVIMSANLDLSYLTELNLSAPSSSKSIIKLYETVQEYLLPLFSPSTSICDSGDVDCWNALEEYDDLDDFESVESIEVINNFDGETDGADVIDTTDTTNTSDEADETTTDADEGSDSTDEL